MEKITEQEVVEIINPVIARWIPNFNGHTFFFGDIEYNSEDRKDYYFAEVEFYIWKGQSVYSVFNLIIYLQGENLIELKDIELEANKELERIYSKLIEPGER